MEQSDISDACKCKTTYLNIICNTSTQKANTVALFEQYWTHKYSWFQSVQEPKDYAAVTQKNIVDASSIKMSLKKVSSNIKANTCSYWAMTVLCHTLWEKHRTPRIRNHDNT